MKYSQVSLFCRIVKLNRKYGHLQDKGCFVSVMSCSGNCNNMSKSKSQWTFCRVFYATAKSTYKTWHGTTKMYRTYVPCMYYVCKMSFISLLAVARGSIYVNFGFSLISWEQWIFPLKK